MAIKRIGKRLKRILLWGLFALIALAVSGLFLADHLSPPATGSVSRALPVRPDQTPLDRELRPLLDARPGLTGALFVTDGLDAYATRAISARQAGRSLDIQYYIWQDDVTGHMLLNEIWEAAERGVRVRMLLDDITQSGRDSALLAMAQHPNISLRLYNPFRNREGILRLFEMVQRAWSINHRMHNKAWIADGQVAILGGRNVGVEYFDAADSTNFRDLDILLFGPAVEQASAIFDDFWNSEAVVPITDLNSRSRRQLNEVIAEIKEEAASPEARLYLDRVDLSPRVNDYLTQSLTPHWTDSIQVLSDPPVKRRGDDQEGWLINRVLGDLSAARHKALIVSPYFVPGIQGMEWMFESLANRDVFVAVATNSLAANDVLAVHSGYSRYRVPLLEHGFHLYEMRADVQSDSSIFGSSGASLHTKAYLVDDRIGFVGSFNMDPRSVNLNTEMGVVFDHAGMAAELREEFMYVSHPEYSYYLFLDEDGRLRWLDPIGEPPTVLVREPESTRMQRILVAVLRWLPIESQL